MKRIPVGIEDFKEIIDQGYYYVDKTSLIKDVWDEKVVLYIRPRRFGKTLNMSMLYYFFSIKQKENAYLFDGLDITNDIEIMKSQNQYPVMFISLKDMKDSTFKNQLENFKGIISELVDKNSELFDSESLDKFDKEKLERYKCENVNKSELQRSLRFLSQCLYKHYRKKVMILIDEYDVPLQSAYLKGYYDEMTDFLNNVFSSGLKTNDALEKGILTGCLRIAKESIFTGLNNFTVNTIFSQQSEDSFGFTTKNTLQLLEHYQLMDYEQTMKDWYDGYIFGEKEIYNPWSVLMYLRKIRQDNGEPESFWANTSGNDIIYRYIQADDAQIKQEFDILSAGGTIEKTIKSDLTYREMEKTENIYSFLLFTGYLKVVKKTGMDQYRIAIPNKEIKYIYIQIFNEWFQSHVKESSESFKQALMNEDIEKANKILNDILFQSISYFDYDEKFYHGILIGMLAGQPVSSNQEAGLGRYDIAVLPSYKKDKTLLLELKVTSIEEKTEECARMACQQIQNQKYMEGLQKKGYENILGYGVAFYKKSCVNMPIKDIM